MNPKSTRSEKSGFNLEYFAFAGGAVQPCLLFSDYRGLWRSAKLFSGRLEADVWLVTGRLGVVSFGLYVSGAGGIVVGGFMANWRAQDQTLAVCLAFGALISLLVASAVVADWALLPLPTIMGFGMDIAGPSRDLLVRKAAT